MGLAKGAKRSAIIEAAIRLFLGEGFAATSVDMIAREAKVSKPTIYNHFADKHALFEMAFVQATDMLGAKWPVPKPVGGPPRRQLVRFAKHCVHCWSDETMVALNRLAIAEVTRFPGIGAMVQDRLWLPLQSEVVRILKEMPRPRPDPARANAAARDFLCALRTETLLPRLFGTAQAPTERRRREIAEAAVEALLARLPD